MAASPPTFKGKTKAQWLAYKNQTQGMGVPPTAEIEEALLWFKEQEDAQKRRVAVIVAVATVLGAVAAVLAILIQLYVIRSDKAKSEPHSPQPIPLQPNKQ